MAEYNDNGERIDNGSSNIDSLDGFEYTLLELKNQTISKPQVLS